MKTLVIISGYFVTICVLGCLIAYPIYLLTDSNLERIVSRTILILAVVLFYPTCKLLGLNNVASLGWVKKNAMHILLRSWLVGLIMLLPISLVYLSCGFRIPEANSITLLLILSATLSALISGLIIGIIEESVFRGLLQSQLSQSLNLFLAIIIVNVIYSSVHFLEAAEDLNLGTITWTSGFILLSSAISQLANVNAFADAWIALFLAGIFLSIVRVTTDNLIWCIGIHSGWVAHIKIFKEFTDRDSSVPCASLASRYDNYVGELSIILIVTILVIWSAIYLHKKTNKL